MGTISDMKKKISGLQLLSSLPLIASPPPPPVVSAQPPPPPLISGAQPPEQQADPFLSASAPGKLPIGLETFARVEFRILEMT